MERAKQVIGVSATLGQQMSKNYIKLNYGQECQIIDMNAIITEPKIKLEIQVQLKADMKFTKGSILSAALEKCKDKMAAKP